MDTKVTHEENQLNCFLLMVILIVLLPTIEEGRKMFVLTDALMMIVNVTLF